MREAPVADAGRYRATVIGTLPQFVGGSFAVMGAGWDSVALECDGWIFKFPRHAAAEARLRREVALLGFLRPRITMPLPQLVLHDGPEPFSQHLKISGAALETAQYEELGEGARNALATRMSQLYAELHALPLSRMQAAGAASVEPWMSPDEVLAGAVPLLPRRLLPFVKRTVKAYRKLRIEGDELVYGYFDGHGWNMAFDHATGMLNGVFDFADSGFGSRHRDLSYSNWISADLTTRIIDRYEVLARRTVNRELVTLYTSALRLAELAAGDLPEDVAVGNVVDWAKTVEKLAASQAG